MIRLIVILLTCMIFTGCLEDGTSTGSSTNQTETGNPIIQDQTLTFSAFNVSSADFSAAAVSDVRICLSRLRFKAAGEEDDDDSDNDGIPNKQDDDDGDVDLRDIGYLTLNPTGTMLNNIDLPSGTFSRIEFDIESDCDGLGSPAVYLDNDNDGGTPFTTNEDTEMRFDGEFVLNENSNLQLLIGNLITSLDAITDADDIPDAFEDLNSIGEIDDDGGSGN